MKKKIIYIFLDSAPVFDHEQNEICEILEKNFQFLHKGKSCS